MTDMNLVRIFLLRFVNLLHFSSAYVSISRFFIITSIMFLDKGKGEYIEFPYSDFSTTSPNKMDIYSLTFLRPLSTRKAYKPIRLFLVSSQSLLDIPQSSALLCPYIFLFCKFRAKCFIFKKMKIKINRFFNLFI